MLRDGRVSALDYAEQLTSLLFPATSPPPRWADFTIEPSGPFSLQNATAFGLGQRAGEPFDGAIRLAFCLDRYGDQVDVAFRQDDAGVHGWFDGDGAPPQWPRHQRGARHVGDRSLGVRRR